MTGRRFAIFGICFALCCTAFIGCSGASESAVSSGNDTVSNQPDTLTQPLGLPTICQITNPLYYNGKVGEESDAWQKKMSEKYGLTLTVNAPTKDTYSDYLAANLASGKISGLFYASTVSDVLQNKSAGTILPVGEYLKSNKTWNSMPEIFRNTYKFNGEIWAIPYSCDYQTPWTRYYRSDWLKKLGIETPPSTVDGFVAAVTAIANKDPDGDGKRETNLGVTASGASSWMDLFAACDAGLGQNGSNFRYDYQTGSFTDAMTKAGAADAFSILRNLFTQGVISKTFLTDTTAQMIEHLNAGTAGSAFYIGGLGRYTYGPNLYAAAVKVSEKRTVDYNKSQTDWVNATSIYSEVTVMTGKKTTNLWAVSPTSGAYCLAANTPQPAETVNFFVDMLFGSEENWLTALQGLPENRTHNPDGSYTVRYKDAKQRTTYGTASLVGSIREKYQSERYLFFLPDTTELTKARTREIAAYHGFLLSAEWSTGAYYYLPHQYAGIESATYRQKLEAVGSAYLKLWTEAVTKPNTTIDKALADYLVTMKTLGAQQILDEANAAIGVVNTPVYS